MKKRKLTGFELVWYLAVFGFLFVWFTQIHPLVVYDADDWTTDQEQVLRCSMERLPLSYPSALILPFM